MDDETARKRIGIFHNVDTDWVLEGTPLAQQRWHNQKYFTWVEQQNKTVDELNAQLDDSWWAMHAARAQDIDTQLIAARDA